VSDLTPDPSETPAPPATPVNRRALGVMIGVGLTLVLIGIWLVFAVLPGYLTSPETPVASREAGVSTEESRKIQATLFYVSDDGLELVPVSQEVRYGATVAEQARFIVEAQIAPPATSFVSAIPRGVSVRGVFLGGRNEAYIDLSIEVTRDHTGGSHNEALAVFAIVNAVTVNLPTVTGVQILVDGHEVDTLAGHVDLRQPFSRALRWVRKAQSHP
jgi:germination protein M